MPAAAVIPAPKAYIKVVAVKKLVVGFLAQCAWSAALEVCEYWVALAILRGTASSLHWAGVGPRSFTLKKLECFKQALPP